MFQVPGAAESVCPTSGVPEIEGATVLDGLPTAVKLAVADQALLSPVSERTRTRYVWPCVRPVIAWLVVTDAERETVVQLVPPLLEY